MCLGDIIIMEVYMIISATGLLAFSHLWLEDSLSWKQLLHIWRSLADWSSVSCCPLTSLTLLFSQSSKEGVPQLYCTWCGKTSHFVWFEPGTQQFYLMPPATLEGSAQLVPSHHLLTGTQRLSVKWHLTWKFLLSYSCRKPALYFGLSMLTFSDAFVVILCSTERL